MLSGALSLVHINVLLTLLLSVGFGQQQQQGGQPSFGMQQQAGGSKSVPFQKVSEPEGSGTSRSTVYLCSLPCMPQFQGANEKSFEELRSEDYQVGPTLLPT